MKIVIYVDYSNVKFNNDFNISNELISLGHNVFLAVNDTQFEELKKNCDKAVLGYSFNETIEGIISIKQALNIHDAIDMILHNS
jgi:hypothetical protein